MSKSSVETRETLIRYVLDHLKDKRVQEANVREFIDEKCAKGYFANRLEFMKKWTEERGFTEQLILPGDKIMPIMRKHCRASLLPLVVKKQEAEAFASKEVITTSLACFLTDGAKELIVSHVCTVLTNPKFAADPSPKTIAAAYGKGSLPKVLKKMVMDIIESFLAETIFFSSADEPGDEEEEDGEEEEPTLEEEQKE